jgi:hypothetical protein
VVTWKLTDVSEDHADASIHGVTTQKPGLQSFITPLNKVLIEKLTVTHLVKKYPAFHGIRRFITVFTTAHHWSLS